MKSEENLTEEIQRSMRVASTFNMLLYSTFGATFLNKRKSAINFDEVVKSDEKVKRLIDLTFKVVLLTAHPNTLPSIGPSETPYFVLNENNIKIIGIELPDAIEEPQAKYIAYVFGDTKPYYYSYEVFSNPSDLRLCFKDENKCHYMTSLIFTKCDNIEEFVKNVYEYTLEINKKHIEKVN